MNKNKKTIGAIVVAIVIAGVFFYAGMSYGGNNVRAAIVARGSGVGRNGATGANFRGNSGGLVAGEVLSQSDQSFVVKLRDGGSKIVFWATSTPITKSATGTSQDLKIGEQVVVTGTPNPDGSVTAQSIQLRAQ